MAFKISDDGKQFTREQEGYIANAAPDAKTGRTAIGYGDNYADKSKPMSKEDAELRFQQRMTEAENDLGQAVTNPNLTQEQKDVMGDMHYNLGLGGMREFIDTVNSGDMTKAEQDILKYTKSFNTDTGQKEELPGLVKRVQARAARWANIKAQNPSLEEDELLKIADEVDAQDPESMNPDEQELLKIADEVDAEDIQMQDANTPGAREKGLDFAADIADSQIALKNSEARMISEKTGMAMDDAVALLEERTAPEILAQHAHSTTARYFPAVSQWAQDPDSYYFMRETGDWARKVELAATPLKEKKSDLSKLLDNTGIMHSRALTIAGMATGMLDVATGKRNLESLDEQQKLNQYTDPGMQEVQKVMQDMGPEFVEALNLQKQAMTDVSEGNIWQAIQNAAKGSGVAADSVLGLMNTLRKNPTAAALVSAESMGSSLVPFASSMTGAASGLVVGAAGGPAGAATGAVALGTVGAFTSAFTLAFAERINDEIAQDFTDPETGKIDYDAAFADPAKVTQRRNEAAVYGLISGGFEAAYGMVAGKYLVKHVASSALKGQALKGVAVGLAKETAVESVGEGATEFVARSSADWFGGKLDSKKLAENAKEGVVEGIMSIGPGAALGTVGAGVRMVFKTPENSADATLKKAKEASQANEDLANLSNLRAAKDSHEASKTNPEQASTLIDAAVTPPPIPEDIHSPLDLDEKTVASESRAIDQAAESGTVAISPSEWDKYHTLNGTDPLKAMAVMSPEIQQEYARNRATDSSIRISHGEWLRLTSEDPHIDVIARVNGNALNALEANETVEGLEADPFTLFDSSDDVPPTPEGWGSIEGDAPDLDSKAPIEIIEADGPEGNLIMRPVELTAKFSRDAEKKIHSSIITRLKRSMKGLEAIDPAALEILGDLEFQHLRARAQMLGEDITDITARLKIGKSKDTSARGTFTYGGRFSPYTVAFTKDASIKTVVHEFGHSWLQEMAEDWQVISNIAPEALTEQQAEYKWAMEKAAELLNMGNIGELMNMEGERRTRIHETFAQTSEMYFLEGKFANSKVRALMETFRGWMVKIAEFVGQSYKQYPPLKVTPEVERMFEAILGASAKVEQEVIPMFQTPLFDPAMLDTKKGEKYMNAVKMARSEAIGRAYTKVFNRGIRERETMINQERNRIFDAAVDEVNDLPEFRVLNSFKAAYEAFKNDKSGDDPRISYDSFLKLFGGDQARADAARALIPREMVAGKKKGGMDAAVFMHMNGMTNPDHMVRLLVDTGKYDEKVNEAFNKKIEEEFPVFKTDDEIHQVAVDALNAGGKAKILLQEMNILMENFKPDLKALIEKGINPARYIAPDAKKVMIAEGTELVRSTNAVKFNANKFLVDSNRHGRDAARHFRRNNIEECFYSKLLEAIQFFAYEKARDAQEHIAKTQKRIKNFVKYSVTKDLANEFDADVMEYGRQVIQAADAGLPIPEFITDNFSRHTGISSEMVHEVNESIVDFYKQSQGRVGKDISVGGYIAFGELIKKIQNVAQRAKFVEIDGRKVGYDQATAAASTEITAVGNVVPFAGDSWGATTRRHFTNTRTLFDSLFKSSEDFSKSVMGSLFSGVVKAESTYNIEFARYRQRMVKAIKNAGLKDTGKPIIGTELGVSFSNKSQLLMFALLYGSKSGQEKVLLGGFNGSGPLAGYNIETGDLDTSKADAMLLRLMNDGTLTQKDFFMLQEIWDINEEIHPLVKDAMRRSDGFNIGHIAGATFKTPWGDFSGGYVPVAVNKELLAPGPYESMLNLDTPGYMATGMYPSMNTGMTNERSKTYYDVDLDMSRLSSYLSASLRIAHLRNPLLDFGRVMESRDVRQSMETKRPGAFKTVLVPWFNGVKNQEYTEFSPSWWDTLARKLRRNVNMATYIGNVASSLRQTLGLLPTISKVGVANVSLSAARFATSPKAMMERASNKSKYMENRMRSSQQDTIRSWEELETNFDWKAQTKEHTDKLTYFMIQATQNMVDVISWDAAYERGMDKGMTDAQAINFANGVVDATQSSSNVTSMTNAQRGTDIYKLFTMVSSVSISMHNLLRAESMRDAGTVARARAIVTMGMVATIFPTLIDVFISENLADLVAGKEEEDEEKEAREEEKRNVAIMMKTAMGSLDTAIPVATRWIGGALMFGSASLSPAFSKLDRSASGGTNAVKNMYKGVDLSAREVGSLMDMMTIVSGVPFTMLGKGSKLNEALTDEESLNDQKDVRREQLADYREESKE